MTALIVPLTIDGLLLETDLQGTLGPFADFTHLPWSVPPAQGQGYGHDENADVPFTSQNALVHPLSDQTGALERGLHLHWALPTPLTVARHPRKADGTPDQSRSVFPDVPNRWLVTRYANSGDPKSWIVESDYLWPEGTDWAPGRVSFPVAQRGDDDLIDPNKQPYRYLGRAYEVGDRPAPLDGESYLGQLIAPGYGEMAFNAVYPNCRNIFGFHDPMDDLDKGLSAKELNGFSYRIWGWYSDAANDEVCKRSLSGGLDDVKELGWDWINADACPERLMCYGNFRVSMDAPDADGPPDPNGIDVVVANTGTEALSAHIAHKLVEKVSDELSDEARDQRSGLPDLGLLLEHQLEAFHLEETLKSQQLDLEAKFKEARHTKTFHSVSSGREWVLVPNTTPQNAPQTQGNQTRKGQSQEPEARDLPKSIARDLARLNDLQGRVDRLQDAIDGQRAQIFAQWHKYITCCYHPDDAVYPPIDDVRLHISGLTKALDANIARLETKDRDDSGLPKSLHGQLALAIGTLTRALTKLGAVGVAARALRTAEDNTEKPPSPALKPHLLSVLADLVQEFPTLARDVRGDDPNAVLANLTPLPDLKLAPAPSAPYWQPNDPVVLLVGEGSKHSDRHPKLKPRKCQITTTFEHDLTATKTASNDRMATLLMMQESLPASHLFQDRVSGANPWHPILLEWEVAVETQSDVHVSDRGRFIPTCFKDSYQLSFDEAETLRAKNVAPQKTDGTPIRGRSILSGHAVPLLNDRMTAFLATSIGAFIGELRGLDPAKHPMERSIVDDFDAEIERDASSEAPDRDLVAVQLTMSRYHEQYTNWVRSKNASEIVTLYLETPYLGRADESAQEAKRGTLIASLDPDAELDPAEFLRQYAPDVFKWLSMHAPVTASALPTENVVLRSLELLGDIQTTVQTQALGGFNQGLLMQEQVLQFDPVDPLGYAETRAFSEHLVRDAVRGKTQTAPVPHAEFHPLRMGTLKVDRLRLVDNFGRCVDLNPNFSTTHQLDAPKDQRIELLPRIAQPARLLAQWRSADAPEHSSNTHPATSPLCGWVMADNFNGGLAIYDADGALLGGVASDGQWRAAPGRRGPAFAGAISNRPLGDLVSWLEEKGRRKGFVDDFVTLTNRSLENIDPEGFQSHQARALTSGRPMALVRLRVGVELKGAPAQSQSWESFQQELSGHPANTHHFEKVRIPMRIGEHGQLNDGLVGYWSIPPTGANAVNNPIRMPLGDAIETQSKDAAQALTRIDGQGSVVWRAIADAAFDGLALIDPRGALHVTTGVLPTRKLQLPHAQFAAALGKMDLPLRVGPLITSPERTEVPLPNDPHVTASWIQRDQDQWTRRQSDATPSNGLQSARTEAISSARSEIREGWLTLSERVVSNEGEADA